MESQDDWSATLKGHPIFARPTDSKASKDEASLELSASTLPNFTNLNPEDDSPSPSGRRQTMVIKDTELIVAVGKEIRVTALKDTKLSSSTRKAYKVLHTPNIQFEIRQLALNPSGKLLVAAGAFQVAVVVLPRPGYMRLVPPTIDCKSIQVGQFYHGSPVAPPVAKVQWHPWGEAGSTLMVMTVDGKLREYDISVDTEEPTQIISFTSERRTSKTFNAFDAAEQEVASFTLGKGRADWGPLTIYAVMKSGDVYSVCPYMPKNASIPSSHIHALECFVAAKQEYLANDPSVVAKALSTTYDYQRKYINALLKQLLPGTVFPASSRSVLVHPPNTLKGRPMRQGPFLLQPSPRSLVGSEGGDATDIVYLAFGNDVDRDEDGDGETERLGIVLIATQDGRVDVCLDVEKVEARWETRQGADDLPMLAVYETVDLGLISTLSTTEPPILDLLQGNHPVFHPDPIHDDTVYVYHAFGVHVIHLERILSSLSHALRVDDGSGEALLENLVQPGPADVRPIVTTFSIERRASNPVISVAIPNDVYLSYSIFILTSAMRVVSFTLNMRLDEPEPTSTGCVSASEEKTGPEQYLVPIPGPSAYTSLLSSKPFEVPAALSRTDGLPASLHLALPDSQRTRELRVTPDTLRYLGKTVDRFTMQIRDVLFAYKDVHSRVDLQRREYVRQQSKLQEMRAAIEGLKGPRQKATEERMRTLRSSQDALLGRFDRVLQAFMKRANPELSDHEKKWFEELKRMENEVLGSSRQDAASLRARLQMLQHEYARLSPHLKALKDKQAVGTHGHNVNHGLGASQAFEFGQQFTKERTKLQRIQKDLAGMAKLLELPLSRAPPLKDSRLVR
ncbi:hypothetical protein OF83DRAFT_162519 [Amylostereum chailletii]|nr:hypothetical protein OF83DRAFT_162519 [Amylostereum chailletii]